MAKLINLTQGQVTIVDDCDADLAYLNWCAKYDKTTNGFYVMRKDENLYGEFVRYSDGTST